VVSEVNDQILTWAFNRQRELNPDWLPFYFDCFTLLATGRKSETLQIEVATLQSQGVFTTADVNEALKALGINPAENDEDLMVGVFRSRLQDSPRQESSLRRSLEIIGLYRQSEKLIAASKGILIPLVRIHIGHTDETIISTHVTQWRVCLVWSGCRTGYGGCTYSLGVPSQSTCSPTSSWSLSNYFCRSWILQAMRQLAKNVLG
jgi:hypothetical protein